MNVAQEVNVGSPLPLSSPLVFLEQTSEQHLCLVTLLCYHQLGEKRESHICINIITIRVCVCVSLCTFILCRRVFCIWAMILRTLSERGLSRAGSICCTHIHKPKLNTPYIHYIALSLYHKHTLLTVSVSTWEREATPNSWLTMLLGTACPNQRTVTRPFSTTYTPPSDSFWPVQRKRGGSPLSSTFTSC